MCIKMFLLLLFSFILIGCATKTKIVNVPQRCDVIFPAYPLPTNNAVENLKNLAIYTEQLECALDFCINGKNIIPNCKIK